MKQRDKPGIDCEANDRRLQDFLTDTSISTKIKPEEAAAMRKLLEIEPDRDELAEMLGVREEDLIPHEGAGD